MRPQSSSSLSSSFFFPVNELGLDADRTWLIDCPPEKQAFKPFCFFFFFLSARKLKRTVAVSLNKVRVRVIVGPIFGLELWLQASARIRRGKRTKRTTFFVCQIRIKVRARVRYIFRLLDRLSSVPTPSTR